MTMSICLCSVSAANGSEGIDLLPNGKALITTVSTNVTNVSFNVLNNPLKKYLKLLS